MNSGKRKRGARVRKRRKENIRKGVVRVRDTETGKPNFDINCVFFSFLIDVVVFLKGKKTTIITCKRTTMYYKSFNIQYTR